MLSTGNDIISLALINKQRSNESRFYQKILAASEKIIFDEQLTGKIPFEIFVWLCWSVKESAYKYLKRKETELVFSPTRNILQRITFCSDTEALSFNDQWEGCAAGVTCWSGSLIAGNILLYFRTKISGESIATVVSDDESFTNIFWGVRSTDRLTAGQQSGTVRSFFLEKFSSIIPGKHFCVKKNSTGCPVIFDEARELDLPVSFSHHGKFVSYSFALSS